MSVSVSANASVSALTEATPQARLRALAATATIGTERLGGDPAVVDTLLSEAAACGLRARAGWRPRVHTGSLAPCPADERPVAPAPAIARLHMLFADRDPGLIEEWATLAVSHAVRVDGATAPLLLDWWARQATRPPAVFAALGRQGEWLASLNPDWQNRAAARGIPADTDMPADADLPADTDTRWQTGTSAQRLALLAAVRQQDPPRALALVASTWKDDTAAERQNFIEALLDRASMADEEFLEAALDDRSKIVRRHAAAVLARVPASRWRQRMSAAARQFIAVESRGPAPEGAVITLRPPETFDPAWERDGIERQPPKGVGQRAWWLRQILAGADLGIWSDHTGLPPAAVLEALRADDFAADAVHALAGAARLARDPEWSAALARHLLRQSPIQVDAIGALLEALAGAGADTDTDVDAKATAGADAERLALEIAAADALGTIEWWVVLAALDRPWSFEFSRDVMTLLSNRTANLTGGDHWRASQLVAAVSRRLDPRAIDAFESAVTRSFSPLKQETIAPHVDRVRVRAEMRKEFSS